MRLLGMIPARLGSKRIPRKNLRYLAGKPLLQYPIDLCREAAALDEVWVNSESDELGALAKACGARFHKRPAHLSTDEATNQQFVTEFLRGHPCDFVVMVNPTSPLLLSETLRAFCGTVRRDEYDTVLSVQDEYAECFLDGRPMNFPTDRKTNSQNLTPVRKVVWALTAWRRESFLQADEEGRCGSFHGRIGLVSIPKTQACDLDTPEDWAIAEGMFAANAGPAAPTFWSPNR